MNHVAAPQKRTTRFPDWLKKPVAVTAAVQRVASCIGDNRLHTVCEEAKCPNRSECFSRMTATFLVLGNRCTRSCGFCGIGNGNPLPLDPLEPLRIAQTAHILGLRHIVITSVTRDDCRDGGASHFVQCVQECRRLLPHATLELLIPDCGGNMQAIDAILEAVPEVLNHNIETVPRLYSRVRRGASYDRSLSILARASASGVITKSGIMVGLGESDKEVCAALHDVRKAGCSIVTIGQYLQPSQRALPVERYVSPQLFRVYEQEGAAMGFSYVAAGPFVRSSYKAQEAYAATTYSHSRMV
ncbi:MAG: lipoyl synthase [Chitinispirillaceae bacterium]|nr:lipoyl synthase [Chitinispirillaceae bacterium]